MKVVNDEPELRNPYAEIGHPDSGQFILPKDAEKHVTYYCPDPKCTDDERVLH
jgi:hypothetical protein